MISDFRDDQRQAIIERLGVFELRGLAREMGIPSPTTKKRDELVSLILQSFSRGTSQDVKVQKRGRPYKKLNSLNEIISSVAEEPKLEICYESVLGFAQEEVPLATINGESSRIEGIARVVNNNVVVYQLNGNARVFVGDLYGVEKIENGDLVELTAQQINAEDDFQALSISLINGVSAVSYRREFCPHGEPVICNAPVACSDFQIIEGRRNACLIKEDLYETGYLNQLYDYCKKNRMT